MRIADICQRDNQSSVYCSEEDLGRSAAYYRPGYPTVVDLPRSGVSVRDERSRGAMLPPSASQLPYGAGRI